MALSSLILKVYDPILCTNLFYCVFSHKEEAIVKHYPPPAGLLATSTIFQGHYSLALLFRWLCSMSIFSSAGVSFGRSILSVSLLSLPVNLNGTW